MALLIKDMPREARPRERMLQCGAGSLSNAELLALFLRTGIPGRSAIQIAQDLIDRFGGVYQLGCASVAEIAKLPGIGPAKACQIKAAFELGIRGVREHQNSRPMDTVEAIYKYLAPQLAFERKEKLLVISLDSRMQIIATHTVSIGTSNQTLCEMRDIMQPPVESGATNFVLAHNHPSGNANPSQADFLVTLRACRASRVLGIKLVDHIIVGREQEGRRPYYSFAEEGELANSFNKVDKEDFCVRSMTDSD